jgi:hypothetical protein
VIERQACRSAYWLGSSLQVGVSMCEQLRILHRSGKEDISAINGKKARVAKGDTIFRKVRWG